MDSLVTMWHLSNSLFFPLSWTNMVFSPSKAIKMIIQGYCVIIQPLKYSWTSNHPYFIILSFCTNSISLLQFSTLIFRLCAKIKGFWRKQKISFGLTSQYSVCWTSIQEEIQRFVIGNREKINVQGSPH